MKKWQKWGIAYVGVIIACIVGQYFIGKQPVTTTKTYIHSVVENRLDDALSMVIGQAKKNIANQKGLLKQKGDVLRESYHLKSFDWKLQFATVESDVTVALPDGTTDREHQVYELSKQDGSWKIARVENLSPLEEGGFYLPAFGTDGVQETITKYLTDQLAGKPEAKMELTGLAYTAAVTASPVKMTPMKPENLEIQPIGRKLFGELIVRVSYTLGGEQVPKEMKGKCVDLLARMEKVGTVWKIASLESL
ncbi:hypothetical protein DNHGIG_40880 [Collibacillus ludicampi]|uniref:DUF4878 domain-containing protein n=1 Tax=Collibacillus ludicampi TaxID=2771369 RepID=A0AAV4LKZ9_9BACL|nr:hypothetical protein [Collibacillus ludicampi]GIM48539.1 hypothetical protein DNHGIG_40880 [Collibacillus ludicampi]